MMTGDGGTGRGATLLGGAILLALVLGQPQAAAGQAATVILVRHAEKAAEPSADPGLTAGGEARAQALAEALEAARLDAVLVTEYRRTQLTGAPTARRRRLTPIVVPVRGDSLAHAQAVVRLLRARPRGDAVLVVEHSNTIPAIIAELGGPALPELCAGEYATMFVLAVPARGPPHVIRATYGAAEAADARRCGSPAMK